MEQPTRFQPQSSTPPPKVVNKTFYRFVFSFVAVVAGTLLFILALGISSGVQ